MVHSLPDVTSTGVLAVLSNTSVRACWVQIQSNSANNAAGARVGDSVISSTRGAILLPGGSQFYPPCANANSYDLSTIFLLANNADVFEIIYHTD